MFKFGIAIAILTLIQLPAKAYCGNQTGFGVSIKVPSAPKFPDPPYCLGSRVSGPHLTHFCSEWETADWLRKLSLYEAKLDVYEADLEVYNAVIAENEILYAKRAKEHVECSRQQIKRFQIE